MDAGDLTVAAALAVLYAAVSGALRRTWVSEAMVFLGGGIILGGAGLGLLVMATQSGVLRLLAEAALALILFIDASHLHVRSLERGAWLSARLLGIGLPLTILAGIGLALVCLPDLNLAEAAILAVAVAPTDAALGKAVVTDERVPSLVRDGLTVESGLNDGLCVPLLYIALAAAASEFGTESGPIALVLEEIGFGIVAGAVVGLATAALLRLATTRQSMTTVWRQILPLAATGLAYGAAAMLGGSGLISAFVAGLAFGALAPDQTEEIEVVEESISSLLSAMTFAAFGAVVVPTALDSIGSGAVFFAVATLTIGRMVPVAISLVGSSVSLPTIAYAGWFGPRGLASIVFSVIILQGKLGDSADLIIDTIVLTVGLSVFVHGLSAQPLTNRYAAWLSRHAARGREVSGESA